MHTWNLKEDDSILEHFFVGYSKLFLNIKKQMNKHQPKKKKSACAVTIDLLCGLFKKNKKKKNNNNR